VIPDGGLIWAETCCNPSLNNWQYLRCDRQCVCLLSSNKISKCVFSDVASRPGTAVLWRKYAHANFGYVRKLTWRSSKFIFRLFVFKLSNSKRKETLHLGSPGHLHTKFVLEHGYRQEHTRSSPKTLCMFEEYSKLGSLLASCKANLTGNSYLSFAYYPLNSVLYVLIQGCWPAQLIGSDSG
jgi:hypothetical protein